MALRPAVLGLTGSPVKPGELQNNLDARLVTVEDRSEVEVLVPVAQLQEERCVVTTAAQVAALMQLC